MEAEAALLPPRPANSFQPKDWVWPRTWFRSDIHEAVYMTFSLFAQPTAQQMNQRLDEIENDWHAYPCSALRRDYNIRPLREFDDELVVKFKKVYPQRDETDGQIERALKLDLKTKRRILIQAALEDGVDAKRDYRLKYNITKTLIRYPRFGADEGTGRQAGRTK